jgi:hypothetical protein
LFQQATRDCVNPFPKTLREFQSKFAAEEACQQYLAACLLDPEDHLAARLARDGDPELL